MLRPIQPEVIVNKNSARTKNNKLGSATTIDSGENTTNPQTSSMGDTKRSNVIKLPKVNMTEIPDYDRKRPELNLILNDVLQNLKSIKIDGSSYGNSNR